MRIGVFGYGHWGKILNKNFDGIIKKFDKDSMIYVYDPFVRVKDRIGFGNLDTFLDNIDIAVIATPAEKLYENSVIALKRGKHVFCEKPILHPCYLDDLYQLSTSNNLTFFVDNLYIYNENLKNFGLWVGDSKITHIDVDWYNGYLPRSNVNVFTDLAWHPLNIIYCLLEDTKYDKDDFIICSKKADFITIYTKIGNTTINLKFSWLDREKVRRINLRTEDGNNFIWDEANRIAKEIDSKEIKEADFVEDNPLENCINSFFSYVENGVNLPNWGMVRWTSQFVEDVNNKLKRGEYESKVCRSCSAICTNSDGAISSN